MSVSLVSAVWTSSHATGILDTVAEPFPAVYIRLTTSGLADSDQLPRGSGNLLLAFCSIKILLGLGADQLESFAAFFTFPGVKFHFSKAVLHIEAKVLRE